jgi:hypothetical protein
MAGGPSPGPGHPAAHPKIAHPNAKVVSPGLHGHGKKQTAHFKDVKTGKDPSCTWWIYGSSDEGQDTIWYTSWTQNGNTYWSNIGCDFATYIYDVTAILYNGDASNVGNPNEEIDATPETGAYSECAYPNSCSSYSMSRHPISTLIPSPVSPGTTITTTFSIRR